MNAMNFVAVVLSVSLAVVTTCAQEPNRTVTNADIINLVKAGIGDSTIILTVQKATNQFDTSPEALIQLKAANVSDAVLNAMLSASPRTVVATQPPQQDCSQMLDKVIASIGSPEKLASVNSSSLSATSIVKQGNSTNRYQINRLTVWSGSVHLSRHSASGPDITAVITPDFNYLVSGKMTMAVPASTLEEIQTGLGLDLIFISKHRSDYRCVQGSPVAIGNINAETLKIKSSAVEGVMNVEPTTGRLLRTSYLNTTSGEAMTEFSDWRLTDDISVAFKRRTVSNNTTTDLTVSEYHCESVAVTSGMQPSPGCDCYPSNNAPSILQISPNQNVTVHVGQPVQLRYDGTVICHRQMIWDMDGKERKSVDQVGDLIVGSIEWEIGSLWALPLEWGVVTYSGYAQTGTYQVTFKLMLQCHDEVKNCTHTCIATKIVTIHVIP